MVEEKVTIKKADVREAEKTTIFLLEDEVTEEYTAGFSLLGLPLCKGIYVVLINSAGDKFRFTVEDTEPEGIVMITKNTNITA